MNKISDEEKMAVDQTILKISHWIASRKFEMMHSCLTKDATMGFNLACDFLSHELMKIREATEYKVDDQKYQTAYNFHVQKEDIK